VDERFQLPVHPDFQRIDDVRGLPGWLLERDVRPQVPGDPRPECWPHGAGLRDQHPRLLRSVKAFCFEGFVI
jgi:hypothetical protein